MNIYLFIINCKFILVVVTWYRKMYKSQKKTPRSSFQFHFIEKYALSLFYGQKYSNGNQFFVKRTRSVCLVVERLTVFCLSLMQYFTLSRTLYWAIERHFLTWMDHLLRAKTGMWVRNEKRNSVIQPLNMCDM